MSHVSSGENSTVQTSHWLARPIFTLPIQNTTWWGIRPAGVTMKKNEREGIGNNADSFGTHGCESGKARTGLIEF